MKKVFAFLAAVAFALCLSAAEVVEFSNLLGADRRLSPPHRGIGQMASPSKILIRRGGMVRHSSPVEMQAILDLSLACISPGEHP